MIYSNIDILAAIESGTIKIDPFNPNNLQPNSYDVTLDNVFFEVFWRKDGPWFIGPFVFKDNYPVPVPTGATLLVRTKETIGVFNNIIGQVANNSSLRRIGIMNNGDAGFIDTGYCNPITLELSSFVRKTIYETYNPFVIVGQKVGQIIFSECKTAPNEIYHGQYTIDGPLNMIPRKYRDRVIKPEVNQSDL